MRVAIQLDASVVHLRCLVVRIRAPSFLVRGPGPVSWSLIVGIERNAIRRGADGAGVLCNEYDPPGPPAMLALYSFAVRGIARHRMLRLCVCVCILMALAYNRLNR